MGPPTGSRIWRLAEIGVARFSSHLLPFLRGRKVLRSALVCANHMNYAQLLSADQPDSYDSGVIDVGGSTRDLMEAAAHGDARQVDRLLNTGVDVNSRNAMGYAALREAVVNNHENVCRLLLDRGARVDERDDMGWTALHWAATRGHEGVTSLLLKRHADVNAKTNDGDTPAHKAGGKGHLTVLRLLVDNGADLSIRNAHERNVLEQTEERRSALEQRRESNDISPEEYRKRVDSVQFIRSVSRESSRRPSNDTASLVSQQSIAELLTAEKKRFQQELEEMRVENNRLQKEIRVQNADRLVLDEHIEELEKVRELKKAELEELALAHHDTVEKLRETLEQQQQHIRTLEDDLESLNDAKLRLDVQLSSLQEEVHCLRSEKDSLDGELSQLQLEHVKAMEQFTEEQSCYLALNNRLKIELQEVRGMARHQQMLLAGRLDDAESAKMARDKKDEKLQSAEAEHQIEAMCMHEEIEALQSQLAQREIKMHGIQATEVQKTALAERYRNENVQLVNDVQSLRDQLEEMQKLHNETVERTRTESQLREDEMSENLRQSREQIAQLTERLEVMMREKSNVEAAIVECEHMVQASANVLSISETELQLTGKTVGKGSFAEVKAGCWQGTDVAVKTFHDVIVTNYNRPLFLQEILMCSRIRHPHVVAIYGIVAVQDAVPSIILELLEGSLADVLSSAHSCNQYLTFREQVDISIDSLLGISHLHNFQPDPLLHGDLRPTNVLLTCSMRAKIGDLGAAHFAGVSLSIGPVSLDYLAPERLPSYRGSHPHNTSSADMYSMGVTLAEIITGSLADYNSRHRQIRRITNDQVRDLCLRMTDVDPLQRPTARDVLTVMQTLRDQDSYSSCPAKRLVKGKRYGDRVVLTNQPW